jgi:hypothetical protein
MTSPKTEAFMHFDVICREAPGTIHGFLNLRKGIPSGQEDFARCIAYPKPWVERAR